MAEDLINLLFRHGKFDQSSVIGTLKVVRILALGLPGFAIIKLMTTMLYGLGEARAQLRLGLLSIALNLLLGWLLFPYFQHLGVIISSMIATYLNSAQVLWIIYRKFGLYIQKCYFEAICKCIISALIMCGVISLLQIYVDSEIILALGYRFFFTFVLSKVVASVLIYASLCLAFKVKTADDIRRYARNLIKKYFNKSNS
jgi:putative peptidoglycan lipid II flippase